MRISDCGSRIVVEISEPQVVSGKQWHHASKARQARKARKNLVLGDSATYLAFRTFPAVLAKQRT